MNKHRKYITLLFCIFFCSSILFAGAPEWIERLPFAEDAFFGVGSGKSPELARDNALIDIRMQLNSRIDAIVHSVERSDAQETKVSENMERYISDSPLSGAILEDQYYDGNLHWALLRFKEDCGQILMSSAIIRFQDELQIPDEEANEIIQNARLKEVLQISRRIDELDLEEYSSEDIEILLVDENLVLRIINFLPDMASLSGKQNAALKALGGSLFQEIQEFDVSSIDIVGHANPTGKDNEDDELEALSRQRAEILSDVLTDTGMTVSSVSWEGGRQTIGDPGSEAGKGRNRRVEIILRFE